jgi:ADP-L-glycero-D-manno-heptose 6-epimerase
MLVVTGGAGFIGSNLVRALNDAGTTELILVDHLDSTDKFRNLRHCTFSDYMDKAEFRRFVETDRLDFKIEGIFHQGACSNTMQRDGGYMIENNYSYSRALLNFALRHRIPFIYASSAAVYGGSTGFEEVLENEVPLNIYAFSKLAFDLHVRHVLPGAESTVVGLRYFNVYGPNEEYKGLMASCVHQFAQSLSVDGVVKMFEGSGGFGPGQQRRDFVHVGDVVKVNLFFSNGPVRKGIFNVGTGESRTFKDIGEALIREYGTGRIEYIPFPSGLKAKYQSFTQADLRRLRAVGYNNRFTGLEEGIRTTIASTRSSIEIPV